MAWSSPVPVGTRIGSNFGRRGSSNHLGDDYPPPKPGQQGVPIYAIGDGVVVGVGSGLLKGHSGDRNVLIKHPGNIYSYYGHLNSNSVRLNQSVKGGEQIGVMGYRGNVYPKGPGGTHLHLGIIVNGSFVDPSVWLSRKGITVGTTPPVKASAPAKGHPIPGVTSRTYPYVAVAANADAIDKAWATFLYAYGFRTRYLKDRMRKWLTRWNSLSDYTGSGTAKAGDKAQIKGLQRLLKNLNPPVYTGWIDGDRGPMTLAAEAKYLNSYRSRVLKFIRTGTT